MLASEVEPLDLKVDTLRSASRESAYPKVDVMTGTYIESAVDLVIASCDPLSLRRFYYHTAPTDDTRYGFWQINPEASLFANFECGELPKFASLGDFSGNIVQCEANGQKQFGLKSYKGTGSTGQPHPLNTKISYDKRHEKHGSERFHWIGEAKNGTGSVRKFRSGMHEWLKTNKQAPLYKNKRTLYYKPAAWTPYQLQIHEEKRPNGNIVKYEYVPWRNEERHPWAQLLKSITIYNHDQTIQMGSLQFEYVKSPWDFKQPNSVAIKKNNFGIAKTEIDYYEQRADVVSCTIKGSDNRVVTYQNTSRKRDYEPVVLTDINTPTHSSHLDYNGYFLTRVTENGTPFVTEYDSQNRVKEQSSPAGLIAKFNYKDGITEVTNGEGHVTRYHFDTRINKIEHAFATQNNTWDPETGNLLATSLTDPQGNIYCTQTFKYDSNQNPIEETVGEHTIYRIYSTDGFNLLLEERDGGKVTKYIYRENSNLIVTKAVYDDTNLQLKTTYTYHPKLQSVCIKTVEEDIYGQCRITEIIPRLEGNCIGLPHEVIEKMGNDTLLKRVCYTYHPSGKVLKEEHYDATNTYRYTITNTYDNQERLKSTTDQLGHITKYTYDQRGNVIKIETPHDEQNLTYDAANRAIKIDDGLTTKMSYNTLGQILSKTDPSGFTTHYTYNAMGKVTSIQYPDGATEQMEYDPLGNVIKKTDPNGYTTTFTYNCHSQPLDIHYPDGTSEHNIYNPNKTLAKHTDQNGVTQCYTYDIFQHPIKTETYDTSNNLQKVTSATYSPFNKLSETDSQGVTTFYTYDPAGRLIQTQTEEQITTYTYDALGNQSIITQDDTITTTHHDLKGQVTKKTISAFGETLFQESYAYDPAGNQTRVTTCVGTTQTLYNQHKQPIKQIDPSGNETHITHSYKDGYTRITTNPHKVSIIEKHDSCGRLIDYSIRNNGGAYIQRREYTYDLAGNQIQTLEHIHRDTQPYTTISTQWSYGPQNRLESLIESDIKKTTYHYDSQGRLATTTKPDGTQLHREYDTLGRLSYYHGPDFDYHYTYDTNDRLIQVTDPNGTTTRCYDTYGNLTQETLSTNLTLSSQYTPYGQRQTLTYPDQTTSHYTYKGPYLASITRNQQTQTIHRNHSALPTRITLPIGEIHITYDSHLRRQAYQAPLYQASYTYDNLGNIIKEEILDPDGKFTNHYNHDDLGQLTQETTQIYSDTPYYLRTQNTPSQPIDTTTQTYAYDSLYNRTQKDLDPYTVNNLSQVTSDGQKTYTYDPNGNLISDGQTAYTYDSLDRLTTVHKNKERTEYTYDPFHRRLTKTIFYNNKQLSHEKYLYDQDNEIGCLKSDRTQELRILGEGLGAEIGAAAFYEINNCTYFPIHDIHGSTILLLNTRGDLVESMRYTSFGEEYKTTLLSPWRFSSKRLDPETNFLYFGRRYYNPSLGRWLNPDPEGYEHGPNLYAYVSNSPLILYDLYGLSVEQWCNTLPIFCGIPGGICSLFGIGKPKEYMRFENSFLNKSFNGDLGLPELEFGGMGFTNGMSNDSCDIRESLLPIAMATGGYNIHFTYNATHNIYDFHESAMNFRGISTTPIEFIQARWDAHFRAHPGIPYFEECHSQGTALIANALESYPPELRKLIMVAAFAPSKYINPEHCMSVTHYESTHDFVPKLDIIGRNKYAHTIKTLSRHQDAPQWDHTIRSPTYTQARIRARRSYFSVLEQYKSHD